MKQWSQIQKIYNKIIRMIISSINTQIQQELNTKFREYSGGCMKLLTSTHQERLY